MKTPRFVTFRRMAAFLLATAPLSPGAFAADIYWSGTTGGLSDPANWSGGVLPTNADHAGISNGGTGLLTSGDSFSALEFWVGQNGQGTATGAVIQTGGDVLLVDGLVVGRQGSAVGAYTMTGGTLTTQRFRVAGGTTTATGTMTISGGETTLTTSDSSVNVVGIGTPGTGLLTISDSATWNHTGTTTVTVGADNNTINAPGGGHGTLNIQSNAGVTLDVSDLAIGRNNGSVGTVVVDGGTLTLNGAAAAIKVGTVYANNNTSIGGTGTLTLNGGTVTANRIKVADTTGGSVTSGTGTVNLNGGTAIVGGITKGGGVGTVHFNGTIVQASEANADFYAGFAAADLDIQAGGHKFDTANNAVTITQGMSGAGAFTKHGLGTLSLGGVSTYAGGTLVTGGTLKVLAGAALGSGPVTVAAGGTLDFDGDFSLTTAGLVLQDGSTFQLDQNLTFAGLSIKGDTLAEGTYTYATLESLYADIFIDGGSGQINVVAVPEPATLALLGLGFAAAFLFASREPRLAAPVR